MVLTGGQVWSPLLGSSARSWNACSGQIFPTTECFPKFRWEELFWGSCTFFTLSPYGECFFSPPPISLRNKPTPLGCPLPSDPATRASSWRGVFGSRVRAHQFSFQAEVARDIPPPVTPGTEPMISYCCQDTWILSPSCLGRCWDAPLSVCPSTKGPSSVSCLQAFCDHGVHHCDLSLFWTALAFATHPSNLSPLSHCLILNKDSLLLNYKPLGIHSFCFLFL